ncbi:aspartate/glutamate racemase family protein [Undibacterium fentianense]|uniref:Aspartate/glutamate racemase family protein n=1 Tax=Undibacterium fentianense TaxID=2828728 RepID=A0A941E2R5_9BURK|nr:aspartate/glutamate racemase family protein [Undibacterium fentianense]MBR7800376.1 aspartate/glutamate racemase family protein [Undibacterium fentianense]
MKTIGMIGGMSWESTIPYYRQINQTIKQELGGLHSAKVILYSVDFHAIESLQRQGDWAQAGKMLAEIAQGLEKAGAELLVLCTNTMHIVAEQIQAAVAIPFIHIADPTAHAIKAQSLQKIGLLGTRFTMEQAFYKDRLQQHGLQVITPNEQDRVLIHRIIYEELCLGVINDHSRIEFQRIIAVLIEQGAQAIILGCTEISLLIQAQHASVPLFDTTSLHAKSAAFAALGKTE